MSIVLHEHELPASLRAIHDPPARLWVEGCTEALEEPCIAVVGSRRCSPHARNLAHTLGTDLARCGFVIVSGLAYGVDAAAHGGAIDSGGTTVAVLGSGVDVVYPARHRPLARRMTAAGGALVSEYPPGLRPRKHHFPARNRLISGISIGVVVVEASDRSGSLITARMALEQGREVMAVPGLAGHPLSAGCHRLIREGAGLVENADDVLDCLGYPREVRVQQHNEPEVQGAARVVLDAVGVGITTVVDVIEATQMAEAAVVEALVLLEIEGLVATHRHGYVRGARATPG